MFSSLTRGFLPWEMWVVRVPLILLANAACALTVCLYLWYLSDPLLVRSDVNHRTEVHNAILHETAELQGLSIEIHCHVHWASFYFTLSCFWDGDISINWIGDHVLWFWLLSGSCGLAYYGHDLGGLWICRALQVWTIFSPGILNFLFALYFPDHWYSLLHSGFWPTLAVFLQRIPILGWVFQQPFITSVRNCAYVVQNLFFHVLSTMQPMFGLFSFAVLWS